MVFLLVPLSLDQPVLPGETSMQKAVKVQDKYFLKSVHQDIDLLDRKLAHLQKYDVFDSDAARDTAVSKINAARDLLARTARRLVQEGIQFNEIDLPRSFRLPIVLQA